MATKSWVKKLLGIKFSRSRNSEIFSRLLRWIWLDLEKFFHIFKTSSIKPERILRNVLIFKINFVNLFVRLKIHRQADKASRRRNSAFCLWPNVQVSHVCSNLAHKFAGWRKRRQMNFCDSPQNWFSCLSKKIQKVWKEAEWKAAISFQTFKCNHCLTHLHSDQMLLELCNRKRFNYGDFRFATRLRSLAIQFCVWDTRADNSAAQFHDLRPATIVERPWMMSDSRWVGISAFQVQLLAFYYRKHCTSAASKLSSSKNFSQSNLCRKHRDKHFPRASEVHFWFERISIGLHRSQRVLLEAGNCKKNVITSVMLRLHQHR